jgi:transposase
LQSIVHYVGLALGGRPGQSLARRLLLPVSKDTLLRAVRRCDGPRFVPPTVIGIDDWAWRRNQRYGTVICDLERHKTIALLPDREAATAQAWLTDQRQIEIVTRDRGGGYALAVAAALPQATQVADRWHLMENASRAFLDAVQKSMRQIRSAIGAATTAWHVVPEYLDTPKRKGRWANFRTDPDIANPVEDDDYNGLLEDFDIARGHIAPYFISGGDRDDDGKDAEIETQEGIRP